MSALFATSRKLRDRADLDALVGKGIAETPERFGLQVQGTFGAGCECELFNAWFSAPDESSAGIITVESESVPRVWFGANLSFILIGYFSGAYINTYELFRVHGVEPWKPDEEQREFWPVRLPEFCLEALCYSVPEWKPNPELGKKDKYATFLQQTSAEHARDMSRLGIPKCKRQWLEL